MKKTTKQKGGVSGDGNFRDSKGNIIDVEKHNQEVLNKFRDPETGEQIKVGDKHVDFDKVWEELQPATREELGMHRGESMTFPVWILIAVSIFMGIVVGMIGITDTVLEVCK